MNMDMNIKYRSLLSLVLLSFKSLALGFQLINVKFPQISKELAPVLSDFLMDVGAASCYIGKDPSLTVIEPGQKQASDAFDIFDELVFNPSTNTFEMKREQRVWDTCVLEAHFPSTVVLDMIVQNVKQTFDLEKLEYVVENVEEKDGEEWVKEVQTSWKPCVVSNFMVLRFPWHTDEDVEEVLKNSGLHNNKDEIIELQLEGGIAFGTGEHPTTRLCLDFVRDCVTNANNDVNMFLDYGAGSGVLGMAACALAAQHSSQNIGLQAIGIEIDADAIAIANQNSKTNNSNMISYLPPLEDTDMDAESLSVALRGLSRESEDIVPLPKDLNSPIYDACAANILAKPLTYLSETIAQLLKPGAPLGLSGILAHQADMVLKAYDPFFDDVCVSKENEGWVLVTGKRKQSNDHRDDDS